MADGDPTWLKPGGSYGLTLVTTLFHRFLCKKRGKRGNCEYAVMDIILSNINERYISF
jgi:hypothetical protein